MGTFYENKLHERIEIVGLVGNVLYLWIIGARIMINSELPMIDIPILKEYVPELKEYKTFEELEEYYFNKDY